MIIITGCAGFIGFHLSKKLLKNNKLIGIDVLNNYYNKSKKIKRLEILKKNKNFKFFKIDLNNYKDLNSIIKKYKIKLIVHLAAQPGVRISMKNPYNTLKQNLIPFINVLELARINNVKKFIYASSSSVYGDTKTYPFSENDKNNSPVSIYGATKLSNEIIAESYSKNFKLNCIGLRFFTVYGPFGRPDMAYYSFLDKLRNRKQIEVYNKGNMLRDFTYIDDIIDGIIKIINSTNNKKHLVINLGKGKPDQLMKLIKNLEKYYKRKFKIKFTNSIPLGDIKKTYSNVKVAKKLINWSPKVNLDNGIRKFVDWYKSYYEFK
jgi:UDP-glucuronate 4-epimerase